MIWDNPALICDVWILWNDPQGEQFYVSHFLAVERHKAAMPWQTVAILRL